MIATCPHCQSGFYISPDLAGNILNCSKCKKQVRAPDRRARGLTDQPPPADGIPIAIVADTRAEIEERLKNEVETKHELEQRLQKELKTLSQLQEQLSKEIQAKNKAEAVAQAFAEKLKANNVDVSESEIASLKANESEIEKKLQEAIEAKTTAEAQAQAEIQARTEMESRLAIDTQARKKADESLTLEKQNRKELEARLKAETQARARAEALIGKEDSGLAQLQEKLQEAETALSRTEIQAESATHAKAEIEKQLQEEKEERIKTDSQWKMEVMTKRKTQAQLDLESKAREKVEGELSQLKARLKEMEVAAAVKKPGGQGKRLFWLTFIFSIVLAGGAGYYAYINGYIINSHFDRPVHLPMFEKPVYLPVNLIAFCVCGFLAAWGIYLLQFIIGRGSNKPRAAQKQYPQQPKVEEIMAFEEKKLWRSS